MTGDGKIRCCDSGVHSVKHFSNYIDVQSYLAEAEIKHCTKYIKQRSFTHFEKTLTELSFDPLFFKRTVIAPKQRLFQFTHDGTPYVPVTHQRQLFCQHGSDHHLTSKRKFRERQEALSAKRRMLRHHSYKLDCPARVKLSRQIHYTSHKAKSVAHCARKLASRKLKSCDEQDITWREVFTIEVPTEGCHRNHVVGQLDSGHTSTNPLQSSPSSHTVDDTQTNKRQKLSSADRRSRNICDLLKEITQLQQLSQIAEKDAKLVAKKLREVKTIYLSATKTCTNLLQQPHGSSPLKMRKRRTIDRSKTALERRKCKPVVTTSTVDSDYVVSDT